MKVPPPPPRYEKERNLTRRTVKGAAGGMEGVDYMPDPLPGTEPVKATVGAGANRDQRDQDREAKTTLAAGSALRKAGEAGSPEGGLVKEDDEMILDDEDATTREQKYKQNFRTIYRDRLTVDKDAPQKRRKNHVEIDQDPPEHSPESELNLIDLGEAIAAAGDHAGVSRAHLFVTAQSRVGDPGLTDPDEMHRALGTPNAYASHALLLAESYRTLGATRAEAIEYLGKLFVAVGDRAFARSAIKELGPGTGIIDLYPLEVMAHLLEAHPGFLPRAGFGRLFTPGRGKTETLHLRPGVPRLFKYSAELKVRSFALSGGGRPGYTFEPGPEPGRYSLRIDTPGEYQLLISAVTKSGHTIIDRLTVKVRGKVATRRLESVVPRDEAKLRAWPVPEPRPLSAAELLEEEAPSELLSTGELVRRQQLDALRGPKGDDDAEQAHEPQRAPESNPEDQELSHAEAAMIWLALATHSKASDIVEVDPRDED